MPSPTDQQLSSPLSPYVHIFFIPYTPVLTIFTLYSQASRLSMNIRALTVERGIATLATQSRLSTLFSFSSHNRAGAGGTSSVDVISSPTGIPARQGEDSEELEGGFYDEEDDDSDACFEERDNAEDEEIILEDRSVIRRGEDVE